jgi:hypothetical protein
VSHRSGAVPHVLVRGTSMFLRGCRGTPGTDEAPASRWRPMPAGETWTSGGAPRHRWVFVRWSAPRHEIRKRGLRPCRTCFTVTADTGLRARLSLREHP